MSDGDGFPPFRSVAIIGLGLIGGSLGRALRSVAQPPFIYGWDAQPGVATAAQSAGVIDRAADELATCVADAELVVLAVPVRAMQGLLDRIAPHLAPGATVTDVGSTKHEVCTWAAASLPAEAHFVGGHPMAGSEQHGLAHARSDMFHGARYCLTPDETTPPQIVERLASLVRQLGACPLVCRPADHDRAVAAISHLPFVLSTTLIDLATSHPDWPTHQQFAATGFRDIGRLASGDVPMHRDICLTNHEAIRAQLLACAARLTDIADHLEDAAWLEQFFAQAQTARNEWLRTKEGK